MEEKDIIMEDKELNEQESLKLITQMIQNTRRNLDTGSGNMFLLWGYVSAIVTLVVFAGIYWTRNPVWMWGFWGVPVLGYLFSFILVNGEAAATEIHRHELFGCTGEEMVQEMKPYFVDFPNVKNNCLRFEVSPSVEESAGMTNADWAKLGNDFMQRMGLMNHQYIIVKHSGTEKNRRQAHLHILANRVSLSGELYKDNWIGKRATEAANCIARERNLVQSKDIGKANREEIKQAMDGVLARMQGFDLAGFSRELEKLGFRVREARASTGKLNGYYVTSRSGTEYKASEIGKGYTLAHIEKTQKKMKYNSISKNYGNTLKPQDGGLHL